MQLRRHAGAGAEVSEADVALEATHTIASLAARIAHLETQIEGLQDAVHREGTRQNRRITELEARTEPAALAVALDRDQRERGL